MSGNQMILKEYLLALGFKVDETGGKKFDTQIGKFDVNIGSLAKRLAAAGIAAQAFVTVFANSMEKLYYASKRTESAVGNIQALEYAGRSIGLSGEQMRGALENMSRSLRANPGLTGLLESLGVQVTGRDKADVLTDLVTQLGKMPFYAAQQYASLFGIDPDTLLMMQQGLEEMKKAQALRKQMAADAGLDTEAAAKAGKEYMNQLREIMELFGILKDTAALAMLEPMKNVAAVTKGVLKDWTEIIRTWNGVPDFIKRMAEGIMGRTGGPRVTLTPEAQKRVDAGETGGPVKAPKPAAPAPTTFSALESQYGLPPGLLDRMWAKESARGKYMLSPAGAKGHFGFMDKTAKEVGLDDPNDLGKSATAAAKYMAQLMSRYNGDVQKALAAYNWGMGNVDRKGMANAPWETQDYVATISGKPIQVAQTNNFTITTPDPQAAARAVSRDLGSANSQLTRAYSGVPQ